MAMDMTKQFCTLAGGLLIFLAVATARAQRVDTARAFTFESARLQEEAAWATVPDVLDRIRPPVIPDRDCVATNFGASAEASDADDRPGIVAAMTSCAEQGGGRVVLPAGDYLSKGPIHFQSRINLHLEEGAVLHFGSNPEDYTPLVLTRWEGTFAYNYSPFLYARDREDVAITGEGVIDGRAEGTWSRWKRDNDGRNQETESNKPRLRRMGAEGVPVEKRIFGDGRLDLNGDGMNDGDGLRHYLRPGLVQFLHSSNILLEGVTLRGSPFWTTHFVLCENVIVRGTTIRSGTTNDDGIDPDGSRYVLIENNDIHVGDDAIAIKAGRDADGRAYPGTAYVVIRNNRLWSTVGGAISIGSEMSGGVEWVFVENNEARNETGAGFYVKSNLDRGGYVRHVYVRALDVEAAAQGVEIATDYKGYRGGDFPPDVHDIFLSDVRFRNVSERSIRLFGRAQAPLRRIFLENIEFTGSDARPILHETEDLFVEGVRMNGRLWTPD